MKIGYFNRNFFKLKRVSDDIEPFLREFGLENTTYLKIIKNTSVEILRNKQRILSFLEEKSTDTFKDLSNSDLILITLLINHFKVARRDINEIQCLGTDEKAIATIIKRQEIGTLKKLLKEKKFDLLNDVYKQLSKIRLDLAIIVKPKRDSERILKIKLLIELLHAIIEYEKSLLQSDHIDSRIATFEEDFKTYTSVTDVQVVLDFKHFDGNRWDKILAANVNNISGLIKSIKLENNNCKESKLNEKSIIVAINTLNGLHDLMTELRRIKDVDAHRSYFNDKFMKIVNPIAKAYENEIDWSGVIEVLKKAGWENLYYIIPRRIRKKNKAIVLGQ